MNMHPGGTIVKAHQCNRLNFYSYIINSIFIVASLLIVFGCSAGSQSLSQGSGTTTDPQSNNNTGTISGTIQSSETTSGTNNSTLPSNIFGATDTDTPPTAPVNTVDPASQLGNCLTSDNSLFGLNNLYGQIIPSNGTQPSTGGSAANQSCSTGLSQDLANNLNLQNLGLAAGCLKTALGMAPSATDSYQVVSQKTLNAQVYVLRCVRYAVQQAAQATQWPAPQMQAFANNDNSLYGLINQISQQFR